MKAKSKIDFVKIGQRIKKRRDVLKISQAKLAEESSLSAPYVGNVETGADQVGLPGLVEIANSLGVGTDYLLAGNVTAAEPILDSEMQEVMDQATPHQREMLRELFFANAKVVMQYTTE